MSSSSDWHQAFALGQQTYLDGATDGPLPHSAAEAAAEALSWERDPERLDWSLFFGLAERIREAAARMFNCRPDDVSVSTGASHGTNLVAMGLDWRPGDHVVLPEGEFPSIYLPWQVPGEQGVELTVVEQRHLPAGTKGVTVDDLMAAMRPTTRAVAVGHVNFASGFRIDIERLGAECAQRNIALVVDASQSLGAVPLDARASQAAVIAASGYKWLCSPYGTGLTYVHPDWVERLRVPAVNWKTVEESEDFNNLRQLELKFRPGARRFDPPETVSLLGGTAMASSLEFLTGIGIGRIFAHVTALIDRLLAGLPEGFRPDSVLEPEHRSTIVRVVGPDEDSTRAAYRCCREAKIMVSLREGGLRVSPGVWNNEGDIDRLLAALRAR